ncbi:flavodoxin family protein [Candidatus Neomarinimicrobiota bacterium]
MRSMVYFRCWILFLPFSIGLSQEVLVVYFSTHGHTAAMADAVAQGVRSVSGVTAKVLSVDQAKVNDALSADAIILGSPVYNANVAPPIQDFINSWPFEGQKFQDKIGAAFVTGGGISAGEELVQLNILHSMLIFRMIIVGGPNWEQAFGASAITGETPFNHEAGEEIVHPDFLAKGEALGRRVAVLSNRLNPAR